MAIRLKRIPMDFIILENNFRKKDEKRSCLRILLVQSPTGRPEMPIYPLGLAFIAGQLKGHLLRGLDLSLGGDGPRRLEEALDDFRPHLVGISLRNIDDSSYPVTHSYIEPFAGIMETLLDWEGKVVVGGTGFSIYPGIILEEFPRIDFGIPGEGEEIFPELVGFLEEGGSIEGWDGGRLLPWVRSDLGSLKLPDYGLLELSDYPSPDSIGVQSRRGCAYRCRYCTYGYLSGRDFRTRPVEHVVRDIRALEKMGVEQFQFVDSVFNAPEDYFISLLEALEKAGPQISWSAWVDEKVRPDHLVRMSSAGCVKVDFSPDAITDRGLRLLGKRGRARELLPAVRAARRAGLKVGINFFNGNPGEGIFAFIRKLFFMLRTRLTLGWSDTFVNIGTIRVYEHSALADQMRDDGSVPADCDFYGPVFYRAAGPADWLYRIFQRMRRSRHGG